MQRTPVSRFFTTLVGLWLAIALSEPAALHACAMHGAPHQSAGASRGATSHHDATGAHESSHAPSRETSHAACSCLGSCCAAAPAVLPAQPSPIASGSLVPPAHAVLPRAPEFRRAEPEYARPPSHAPPIAPA